ncbi:unnamed protein product [Caenorhabditis angaria]|uniref:CWH43-like N-terminal domain-containing protein n=1 Tax=Caenorhabditis angaria TaxID=860376 RepID=A0A9P1NB23_9PELO|nr:unnamed protein product [Caenorhabditis angaria]
MMGDLRYAHLPIIFAIVFTLQVFATYTLALLNGNIDPFLPYLSSAGDLRPQSCVFGLFTNICAMLSWVIIFMRHKFCTSLHTNTRFLLPRACLNVSKYIGYAAAVGMFIVANVQETAIVPIHQTAAIMTFACGTLYMCFQTYVTYTMSGRVVHQNLARFRLVLSILAVISFFGAIIFAAIASHVFHSYYPDLPVPRPWNKKIWQPGTGYHNVSAFFEWAAAFLHCMFIVTFAREFEDVEVEVYIYHHNAEELSNQLRADLEQNPYGW